MAIDSRDKRASAANLPFIVQYPAPDDTIISIGEKMMMAGEYLMHPWALPDSVISDDGWDNAENAYDNNTGTYAVGSEATLFTELQLGFSTPIKTDMMRIWAEGYTDPDTSTPSVEVKFYWNGLLSTVFDGEVTEGAWYEYPIHDNGVPIWVSKVSVTSNEVAYDYLRLYEIQIRNLSLTISDSVIPKVGGGLVRNPLLGSGLVT